jgi:MFS transporter, DHA1 family, inner membrane transport protein
MMPRSSESASSGGGPSDRGSRTSDPTWALSALLIGNFVIGTGVLLPAGMLNDLSVGLDVSVSTAGWLTVIGGVVVCLGAPLGAALTSRLDRRTLLAACLALYLVGHVASALAPNFGVLAVLRGITIVAAALFTPQAAATAGLLVSPERRAAAISFIFLGWSGSSVVGIPLGSLVAAHLGWRTAYAVVAALAVLAVVVLWAAVPSGLRVEPLSLSAWRRAVTDPVIVCVLAVSLVVMSAQFMLFSYTAPFLKGSLEASPGTIALFFALFGVAGVVGNYLATRLIAPFGLNAAVLICIGALIVGAVIVSLTFGVFAGTLVGLVIWGLGTFSSNSLQQSRLASINLPLASASIALNTSVLYLGQAIGAGLGGRLIADEVGADLTWAAAALLIVGAALSVVASRLAAREPESATISE